MLGRKMSMAIVTAILIIVLTGVEQQYTVVGEDLYMAVPAAPVIPDAKMRSSVTRPSQQAGRGKQRVNDTEYYLLAKIIECEARDESFEGKLAVGLVVMNRVKSPRFPNTIEGVIFQKGQFQPVVDGGWTSKEPSPASFEAAYQALEGVGVIGENGEPVGDAMFFIYESIADQGSIEWFKSKLRYVTTIGNHDFYTYR
jgi:N-acetylmuramoyl-L-alanine amidase